MIPTTPKRGRIQAFVPVLFQDAICAKYTLCAKAIAICPVKRLNDRGWTQADTIEGIIGINRASVPGGTATGMINVLKRSANRLPMIISRRTFSVTNVGSVMPSPAA